MDFGEVEDFLNKEPIPIGTILPIPLNSLTPLFFFLLNEIMRT